MIKGIRRLCADLRQRMSGFAISIQDDNVRLEHLFLAKLWSFDPRRDQIGGIVYQKLCKVAERTQAEADLVEAGV